MFKLVLLTDSSLISKLNKIDTIETTVNQLSQSNTSTQSSISTLKQGLKETMQSILLQYQHLVARIPSDTITVTLDDGTSMPKDQWINETNTTITLWQTIINQL
jgi:hypothetical protein